MKRTASPVGCVLAVVLLVAGLAACGSDSQGPQPGSEQYADPANWESTLEAANEEGAVTLYLALANFEQHVEPAFEAAYPDIDLTILRQPTGDLVTKLAQEKELGRGGADVVMLSSKAWFDENNADLVNPAGPAVEVWQDSTAFFDNYFTSAMTAFTMSINTEVVPTGVEIEDWDDLLQPELKGLVGISRPDVSPVFREGYAYLGERLGMDFLEGLAGQQPRLFDSTSVLTQAVGSGELALGLFSPMHVCTLVEKGAPMAPITTAKPQPAYGYWTGIVNWSEHAAAAQVLMNWMMSQEGQSAMHGSGCSSSALPSVTNDYPLAEDTLVLTGRISPELEPYSEALDGLFLQ